MNDERANKQSKGIAHRGDLPVPVGTGADAIPDAGGLLEDIRALIEASREQAARAVNSAMVITYWSIGERLQREVLADVRAEYGKQIIERLAEKLRAEYGAGFSRANLFHMIRFAQIFNRDSMVRLSQSLTWTHFRKLIYIDDPLKREYYAQICAAERWSVRTLASKVEGMLFERTAISKKPEELAVKELEALREEDRMSPDLVFRDQYLLGFLGLHDTYSERDLEEAILRELEGFIAELGTDFAFVGRQKRMTIDGVDYRLDLLFFHRRLRRLIAIDLKLGHFQAADKGQMELYLRWLERYEQRAGEESPIGLILCAGKSEEHVELLQLERSGIRVAEYITELPPREILEAKLHAAIQAARRRIAYRSQESAQDGT